MIISVIMPVFNGSKYLRQALDSVADQTFQDFECILIDDCSNDNSVDIITNVAKNDPRFKLLRQECNMGVAAARNRGLSEAKGDYITFLDQDDLLRSHALEYMLSVARSSECDVVAAGINQFNETNVPKEERLQPKIEHTSNNPIGDFFNRDGANVVDVDVWGKLYRRKAIQAIAFPEDVFGADDYVFSFRVFSVVRSVAYINEELYFYRMHASNVTSQMPMRFIMGTLRSREIVWQEVVGNPALDEQLKNAISRRFAYDIISWAIKKTCRNNYSSTEVEVLRKYVAHLRANGTLKPYCIADRLKCNLFLKNNRLMLKLLFPKQFKHKDITTR